MFYTGDMFNFFLEKSHLGDKGVATPKFNEGTDLATGKIDSDGREIVDRPEPPEIKTQDLPPKTREQQRLEQGLCTSCGQDPCSINCDLR